MQMFDMVPMTQAEVDPSCLRSNGMLHVDALHEPATSRSDERAWHDSFAISGGRIALLIGNVGGSEADATALMLAARDALSDGAIGTRRAVQRAADVLLGCRAASGAAPAACIVGIIDCLKRTFTYVSAGGPAPLIRYHDGDVVALPTGGWPIEPGGHLPPAQVVADLREAAVLMLCTNALLQTDENADDGLRRLHGVLADERVTNGTRPTAWIAHRMLGDRPHDDVALLALMFPRSRPSRGSAPIAAGARPEWSMSWSFDATGPASVGARHAFVACLKSKANGGTAIDVAAAELIFGELVGNVVRHAPGQVEITLDWTTESPVLHVRDNGPGFRSRRARERLPADDLSESGRGLFIINAFAANLRIVNRVGRGTHASVTLPPA